MADYRESLKQFPDVKKYLNSWFEQLEELRWTVLVTHLEEQDSVEGIERLNQDLAIASAKVGGFSEMLREKRSLGSSLTTANRIILDKLAEIHAAVWLHNHGYGPVRFGKTPDIIVSRADGEIGVEVCRIGKGDKSDMDREINIGPKGRVVTLRIIASGDKGESVIAERLADRVEEKYEQLKGWLNEDLNRKWALWVSGGRTYVQARPYESESAGLQHLLAVVVPNALNLAKNKVQGRGLVPLPERIFYAASIDTVY